MISFFSSMLCLDSFICLFNLAISSIFPCLSSNISLIFWLFSNNLLFLSIIFCCNLFISSSFSPIFVTLSFFSLINSLIFLDKSACSLFKLVIILSLFDISEKRVVILLFNSFNWVIFLIFSSFDKESLFFWASISWIRDIFFWFNSSINWFCLFDSACNLLIKEFFSFMVKFRDWFFFSRSFKFIFIFFWLLFNSSKVFSFCFICSIYVIILLFNAFIWFSNSSICFFNNIFSFIFLSLDCFEFLFSSFKIEFSVSNEDILLFKLFSEICCRFDFSSKYFIFISLLFIWFNKWQHLSK